MKNSIENILETYTHASKGSLIPILQDIQNEVGFLSEEAILLVGKHLNMPTSKIYGLATFYNQFRFQPKGHYHIQICRGTSCHIMGNVTLLELIEQKLKISAGQTSRDGTFSLEIIPCMGACAFAPVISINGVYYTKLTEQKVSNIFDELIGED